MSDESGTTTVRAGASRGSRVRESASWGLLGVVSTLLGMAAGHLVAAVVSTSSSPVLAVGSVVVDNTPEGLKQWAIRTFGAADKIVLLGSVVAVVLVLAVVAGLLARRRFAYGAGLELLLVALAGAAAVTRPQSGFVELLPSLVTAAVGVGSLYYLVRRAHAAPAADAPAGSSGASRRGVLIGAGLMTLAAAALGGAGRLVTSLRAAPADITLPSPTDPAPPFPDGLEGQVQGITPLRISNENFYRVDTRLDTPIVDVEPWTLVIDGDVEQEVELTFDDLLAMDLIERDITLTCVSNSVGGEFVGGARWLGVRLTDLLEMAGVGGSANQILSTDFDGMTISTPLEVATDGRDSMIAIGMNGEALPRAHGFPARMIVPGLYGFVSACKWITRMTLTTYDDEQAYWTERDWATDAPIKISARIDTPSALDQLDPGRVVVGGVAWAQQKGGVGQVQVRIDGGPWQDAQLGPEVNNDYWRQWFYEWDASEPGSHSVAARVISGSGMEQIAARANPFPEGSSGIQTLQVTVTDG